MNRLFSDFFRKFAGVILEVYRTICRVVWGCLGDILEVFRGHLGGGNWRKKGSHRLFKIALNSLFNDRGVSSYVNCSQPLD